MANTPGAKKAVRKIARRTEVNTARRSRVRTFLRKFEEALASGDAGAAQIPDPHAADLFSRAMQQSMWLPAAMYAVGLVAVMFYERPRHEGFGH